MKENDAKLQRALQEWRVTSSVPPRFTEQVWKRIERAEIPSVSVIDALRTWFAATFARPVFAFAYVVSLITAGVAVGLVQANQQTAQWDRQLETGYVRSVDPYQRGH